MIHILAICGSTRQSSSNLSLLAAIVDLYRDELHISVFQNIDSLPHFNPDLDNEHPPESIAEFRMQLKEADGVLISTPEYAMGVPGTLKNAIDWTVSSMEFSGKPTALITASSAGQRGHAALMETLKVIEANIPDGSQLIVPFIKTKVNGNTITDEVIRQQIKNVIDSFIATILRKEDTDPVI